MAMGKDGNSRASGDGTTSGMEEERRRAREATRAWFSERAANGDLELMRAELHSMGQKELQRMFVEMFDRATTSNNNQWLRRRIANGLGLEDVAEHIVSSQAKLASATNERVPSKRQSARRNAVETAAVTPAAQATPNTRGAESPDEAAEFTPDGVRKSRRAVKPKAIFDSDAFPSAAKVSEERRRERKRQEALEQAATCASGVTTDHHGGKAAVGRRVRVYWPLEGKFFAGVVTAYNARTGLHHIDYDDGDKEEIKLATPEQPRKFEAIEHPALASTPSPASDWPALTNTVDSSISLSMPQPGRPADILSTLPSSWPAVGSLVWGRVRGHGWWPGAVHDKDASHDMQEISFFDNSMARVHRHDLLPFQQYYMVLRDAKKTHAYAEAVSRAAETYESRRQRTVKRRSKKEEQSNVEESSEPPRIWHFEREGAKKSHKRSKDVDVDDAGAAKRGKVNEHSTTVFGSIEAPKTLNDLNKSLEEMKAKMLPLAKESRKTLNKHLVDTARKVKTEAADDDEETLIAADERVVVLDELASIESLIAWSENKAAKSPAKTPDLSFMTKRGDDISPSDPKGLLRQPSENLLCLGEISEFFDGTARADPLGIDDPIVADLGADEVAKMTAPSTPEQHGIEGEGSPFAKSNMSDSCTTLHASYGDKKINVSETPVTKGALSA
jgi:hypothetical protein